MLTSFWMFVCSRFYFSSSCVFLLRAEELLRGSTAAADLWKVDVTLQNCWPPVNKVEQRTVPLRPHDHNSLGSSCFCLPDPPPQLAGLQQTATSEEVVLVLCQRPTKQALLSDGDGAQHLLILPLSPSSVKCKLKRSRFVLFSFFELVFTARMLVTLLLMSWIVWFNKGGRHIWILTSLSCLDHLSDRLDDHQAVSQTVNATFFLACNSEEAWQVVFMKSILPYIPLTH